MTGSPSVLVEIAGSDAAEPGVIDRSHFDGMYAESDDPWHMRASWYEERKRAVLLASLPSARFASAYEPGCAAGDLTLPLARRCQKLLASDGSERAVLQTRQRLATKKNVAVMQAWLPDEWPEGHFDLIVLSEFLYYLAPPALDRLLQCVVKAKTVDGVVVACHWRAPIEGCALAGDALHQRVHAKLQMPRISRYIDDDFCLDVWQSAAFSAAQRESRR